MGREAKTKKTVEKANKIKAAAENRSKHVKGVRAHQAAEASVKVASKKEIKAKITAAKFSKAIRTEAAAKATAHRNMAAKEKSSKFIKERKKKTAKEKSDKAARERSAKAARMKRHRLAFESLKASFLDSC